MMFVAIAGRERGNITFVITRNSDNPSIRAASMSEGGMASKLALKTNINTMCENAGNARPRWVFNNPKSRVIR